MILDVAPAAHGLNRPLGGAHRDLAGGQFGHRPLAALERDTGGRHPRRAPGQQPGRVDAGGQVGQRERDPLVVDDRGAERLPPVGVLGDVFQCGPGNSERLRSHHGSGLLEGAHGGGAGMPGALDGLAGPGQLVLEFLLPAEQIVTGNPDAGELEFGGVGGAAAELVELAHHVQAGGAAGNDEQRLPAVTEFLVDDGVDDVHVGDAAVADPHLVTVDDPVVPVAAGRGAQVADVAAALGFGDRQCRQLQIAGRAEAFRRPLPASARVRRPARSPTAPARASPRPARCRRTPRTTPP